MTFYNVISAILFLGAFRELLRAIDAFQWSRLCIAGTLAAVVFNDMLSTSHLVEHEKSVAYDWKLMLIDLANFALLATALVAIDPNDNLFNVKLPHLATTLSETWFWALLGGYWLLLIVWSVRAATLGGWRLLPSLVVALFFIGEAVALGFGASDPVASWGRFLAFAYLLVYFLVRRVEPTK